MNILVIAATAKEIEPFFEYYHHTKRWQNIDVLITSIGLTAATYHLAKQIALKRPGLIIQAGIAGCAASPIVAARRSRSAARGAELPPPIRRPEPSRAHAGPNASSL